MQITLTSQNFDSEVVNSKEPVLVDFWAEWCGPCHAIAPVIAEIADEYKGSIKVGKLNVDENPDTAQAYHVRSIPTLKLFKDGEIVDEIIGVVPKEDIKSRIDKALE